MNAGVAAAALSTVLCGCSTAELRTPYRYQQGLIIILPGIEGTSPLNINIAKGLADGGIPAAIEIQDWTALKVTSWFVNLTFESRNRRAGQRIASHIQAYQLKNPGRPVCLIGHSGGGGVAVFALEALSSEHPIECAVLLGSALSPEYDLCKALRRTRGGIWNFYSPYDVGFLALGTSLFGTIDREHSVAAGSAGFREPPTLSGERLRLYRERLRQVCYTERMAESGNAGGHTGWASREFSAKWLAPIIHSQMYGKTRVTMQAQSAHTGETARESVGRSVADDMQSANKRYAKAE